MSNETDKPLAGALRAAHELRDCQWHSDKTAIRCFRCRHDAEIIARESGLAELVEAVDEMECADFTNLRERSTASLVALLDAQRKVIAAARRVKGEC